MNFRIWIADIRSWLEEQTGATEFDGTPIDGIRRVMAAKDTEIERLREELDLIYRKVAHGPRLRWGGE